MLAARRIVRANGRTNMPMTSSGIRMTHIAGCTPPGARFFQWPKKPSARIPAPLMSRKLIRAQPPGAEILPVAEEAMRPNPCSHDEQKADRGQRRRHVDVARGRGAAMREARKE